MSTSTDKHLDHLHRSSFVDILSSYRASADLLLCCNLLLTRLNKKIVIEFNQKSIRSMFMLHLVVGVLKTANLKQSDTPNNQSPTRKVNLSPMQENITRAGTADLQAYGSSLKRNVNSFAHPKQDQASLNNTRTSFNNRMNVTAHQHMFSHSKESQSIETSKSKRKKARFLNRSVQGNNRKPDRAPSREILKDQDVLAATQFTPVELNRIITNVGGGYLIKKDTSKSLQRYHPSTSNNIEQYCYLGFDKFLNKTKKTREESRISFLLS